MVTGEMLKFLAGFQHRSVRRITGMTEKCRAGGEWEYPSVVEAMESSGIQPIWVQINMWQTTIAERVACRPVYALCTKAVRMPGTSWLMRWWDQYAVNEPEE